MRMWVLGQFRVSAFHLWSGFQQIFFFMLLSVCCTGRVMLFRADVGPSDRNN
ncbi:hypothetical protein K450DRAFT_228676 [Umbelopsis ramanniana AG]|uniref:Uncharacterized protein n=1 Tax=Umbelopsis ramanniana AG TaxID=1314678 RepID=A0AAD5EFQ6_UMBRA|nr:uncharacterized protein K450DRAFT_228676 [Umbelopsis ramanniana AG]KAI8582379.1 hypothetical protein K450DRAFT_228676 [Umbelopsis ramanniana AG]